MNSYYIVSIKGKNISRFLYKCKNNNINILNIKNISHNEVIIKINRNDYSKLLKIKSVYKLEIINATGLLKFKELIKKNLVIIIMSFLGLLFLFVLTNTIFGIKIISNNKKLNKIILKKLEYYNIKKYKLKKSYNEIQKLKKELLNEFNDSIEWIEISDVGTKYEVKIVERKINRKMDNSDYINIVAKKSGIIKDIYAQTGEKQVDLNTYVNKGDIIISGIIKKGEEEKKYVHAKGSVYAEIWYDVTIEFPLNYTEKIYTNNKKNTFYIKLNNKYIKLKKFKNIESRSIKKLSNRLVPFEIGIEEEKEVKIINDKYTIDEALKRAKEKAKEKVLQSLDKDEYVIDQKVLNFYEKNSKIVLDMFFTCYEEISKEEKFESTNENNNQ